VREQAEARWRIHCGQRAAALAVANASHLRAASKERASALVELRTQIVARRTEIHEDRWTLRSTRAQNRNGESLLRALVPAPWQVLNRARSLVGCSVATLWLEYFTAGGTATYEEFAEMLMGLRRMTASEHDLAAAALNARFDEAGLGSPVASSTTTLEQPLAEVVA
jgi:hypothetical protein